MAIGAKADAAVASRYTLFSRLGDLSYVNVSLNRMCVVHRRRAIILGAVACAVAQSASVRAQSQNATPAQPQFEVATVKPSDPNARGQFRYLPGGTAVIRGVNLRLLIQQSYDVRDFQILGGPSWIGSDRYDITAKATAQNGTFSAEDMRLRLQTLLSDRFRLQLHSETREMSRYELVVAKNGPKLKEDAPPTPAGRMSWGAGFLKGDQVDIRFMTVWLTRLIEQPVGDQTGLRSTYDFELRWAPESTPSRRSVEPEPESAANSNGPSIFTAIQEQLGLKLEPRKGPVPILVIDHVEKPMQD
jgi:bla regulator protein BlaR1